MGSTKAHKFDQKLVVVEPDDHDVLGVEAFVRVAFLMAKTECDQYLPNDF